MNKTALKLAQAENQRLRNDVKLLNFELDFLQKQLELSSCKKKLELERFAQALATVEEEKHLLNLEYQNLCHGEKKTNFLLPIELREKKTNNLLPIERFKPAPC